MAEIHFMLNGREAVYEGNPADRLQEVLRNTFRCTSVKCACREGECGACGVLIDGLLHNSCCVAVGAVEERDVMTLEGYRETARFAVLDQAFAKTSAVQCGFCTPGMILASEALLRKNPHPDRMEIREGLSGNLCRCTGYNAIVEAVMCASREGKGLW